MQPSLILHLRIRTLPGASDSLVRFLREAVPHYVTPGGIRIRLLQDLTDPDSFIEVVEYRTRDDYANDQDRVRNDSTMKHYLQQWRSIIIGAPIIESFRELTANLGTQTEGL